MLDERFRHRLRELASLEKDPLPRGARDRIVFNVMARGPAMVRGARRERTALVGGGAVLAAAAAAALLVRLAGSGDGQIGVVTEGRGAAAPAPALVCESRQAPAANFVDQQQRRLLDLGQRGVATAKLGSDVRVVESSACRTVLSLKTGQLSVHARDLGGGELIVQTRNAEVVAQGTLFAVAQDENGGVTVEVADGRVRVRQLDRNPRVVEAGTRVTVGADLVTETRLSTQALDELRAATQK